MLHKTALNRNDAHRYRLAAMVSRQHHLHIIAFVQTGLKFARHDSKAAERLHPSHDGVDCQRWHACLRLTQNGEPLTCA